MARGSRKAAEFVKVYRFMTEGMGLLGTELLVYARVFSFYKQTGGEFWESKRGIAEFLGISERQAHRSFRSLVEKGLLLEVGERSLPNGRITKRYEVAQEPVRKGLSSMARRYPASPRDT